MNKEVVFSELVNLISEIVLEYVEVKRKVNNKSIENSE